MRIIAPQYYFYVLFLFLLQLFGSCNLDRNESDPLFSQMSSSETGIDFQNTLEYTNEFNIYKYRNFYNGGGVGIGDFNKDGLMDIYLTANMLPNKLYINKGDFQFEDITEKAGVEGKRSWSTGVSIVDINADGWPDIYVSNSGDIKGDNKQNEFFINNQDGTFTDKALEMGLADPGYSTHASFFDYDKDGDLDVYLLNNSYRAIGSFNLRKNERPNRDKLGGDKLLRNDGMVFKDVSEEANIYGSEIGFGLGVAVSDLDKDGWLDMYISNDFFERDYLYMNNGDGTFSEEIEDRTKAISGASMGSDTGDLNGDGFPEIFVSEMLPEGNERYKTTMTFEDWDKYQYKLENGYFHQFTRNALQLNRGVSSSEGLRFSEIGRLSGVEATDWSWSSLITDLNNDGFNDLYITNGLAQDILNQDYLKYVSNEEVAKMVIREDGVDFKQLIDIIPVNKISNYVYEGKGNLEFENSTTDWGLSEPSHSNGAAYVDLDNDGDLDLVVNNVNMPVFIYKNNTDRLKNNYLKLELKGENSNTSAIGAKVTLKADGKVFYQEVNPTRGFQSSVDVRTNFGLGSITNIDTLLIDWYYGKQTLLTQLDVNQTLTLSEAEASENKLFENNLKKSNSILSYLNADEYIPFTHKENSYVGFDRNRLLFHMKSTEGPKISRGDVNGDHLEDIYISGAKGFPGKLLIQDNSGKFYSTNQELFEADAESEDLSSVFFDADGDQDLDLYVASGGSEFSSNSFELADRLYLNDGHGKFSKSKQILPSVRPESTSVVKPSDFDNDGDLDLFVGVRLDPKYIGIPQNGYLLENNGSGIFKNSTKNLGPDLLGMGMITDAVWADYDGDKDADLLVVGEWMNIKVFENSKGKFNEVSEEILGENTHGWWNTIEAADLNNDGAIDFVVGNHGLNSRFKASQEFPVLGYVNDFDRNGSIEQIVCTYNEDKSYPFVLRHDLISQLPHLKKKYLKYESYKDQTIENIFNKELLDNSRVNKVTMLESVALINKGDGTFQIRKLPTEAQMAPIYAMEIDDFNQDGYLDIILGGNLYEVKPEVGRYDASYGELLLGMGDGDFRSISNGKSGLFFEGQIRDLDIIEIGEKKVLLVARNNASLEMYEIHKYINKEIKK